MTREKKQSKLRNFEEHEVPAHQEAVPEDGGPDALMALFVERFKQTHGYEYLSFPEQDIPFFAECINLYGEEESRGMIEVVFDSMGGVWKDEQLVVPRWFSRKWKWFHEIVRHELAGREGWSSQPVPEGQFASATELFGRLH